MHSSILKQYTYILNKVLMMILIITKQEKKSGLSPANVHYKKKLEHFNYNIKYK